MIQKWCKQICYISRSNNNDTDNENNDISNNNRYVKKFSWNFIKTIMLKQFYENNSGEINNNEAKDKNNNNDNNKHDQ